MSKKDYENYLNELYEDFGWEYVKEQFIYLTNPERNDFLHESELIGWRDSMGTLLRKYDPVAFNVSYNEWKRGGKKTPKN